MELYRYILFENFIDIVINEKITLLSPKLWEDSYEGWFWKAFLDSPKAGKAASKMLDTIFAQCWSKNKDSAALWSIYSYDNKAVMIETTKEKLESIDKIFCKEIAYTENAEIEIDDIVSMIANPSPKTLLFPFTKKRSAFLHENEVRVFALIKENSKQIKSIDIRIPKVSDFISNVTVHPFAPDWYVEIVKTVCEKYSITFSGKSHLYDLEEDGNEI